MRIEHRAISIMEFVLAIKNKTLNRFLTPVFDICMSNGRNWLLYIKKVTHSRLQQIRYELNVDDIDSCLKSTITSTIKFYVLLNKNEGRSYS